MVLEGFEISTICKLLDVSDSFVSKWKNIYEDKRQGLLLNHKGSKSFLTSEQRDEVILYLKTLVILVLKSCGLHRKYSWNSV